MSFASLGRNNEFFALRLGLQGIPNKNPDGSDCPPGRMLCLQSKDGQVLRLHSCSALSP
jgi:hypothetical protein